VPRIFEKIYTAANAGIAEQSRARQAIFRWAVATGRRVQAAERTGRGVPPHVALQHRLADHLVLTKVRDLFGGRIEWASSGAAPIAQEILEFFDACGVTVLEGWGMSETAAAGSVNNASELRFGTVGRALPGTELRIADDGELLMRGPTVFKGYYKNEAATAEALAEGWLATGDLAEIDDQGYVSIVGRKKDLIITSSGKNISPSNIENVLKESRWISQAVVFGDNKPYLVALLTLDAEEAPKLAEQLGVDPEPSAMAHDPKVHEALQHEVDEANAHFARIEQVKRFVVLDHDLSQEQGELTPTLKIKRQIVADEFAGELDALYAGASR
jgi:long-chain acyl-CoA synthetase